MMALTPLLCCAPALAQFDMLKNLAKGATGTDPKQIAYFKVKGALTETPSNLPPLFGSEPPMSLKTLLDGFKEARTDADVVAVVVDLQQAALGVGQLQEIHQALRKFAAVDKEVYVHADSLTTGTYAAATGASHISLVPTGDVWLTGLYGESPYLRGALEKLGCTPDFEHCGDYKTAAETLMRTGPSEESREMTKWLLDGIYDGVVTLIAEGRGVTPEKVRSLIDGGPYSAEAAKEAGLVDSVAHRQEFVAKLKERYGDDVKVVSDYGEDDAFEIPQDNIFAMFEFIMKMLNPSPKVYTQPSVAIVYVEGAIQTGSKEISPFGGSEGAFSTSIRKALDKAAEDDSVKAVVLRVDSPGGSALASEIILHATKRVADKKPLVVSMGNVAGSGGYYVTCASETVFADAATITASIGVVGGKVVTTGMWNKLGINWDAHQRGKMAAILSTAEKFSEAEREKIRSHMNTIYDVFKNHVVAARGDRLKKPIDELAGGRVFTGAQALELGLIDKIGGLEDAVKFAAQRASLGEFEVRVIPEPPNIFDLLAGPRDDDENLDVSTGVGIGSYRALGRGGDALGLAGTPLFQSMISTVGRVDPLRAQAVLRSLQRIELIHREHAVMMMPDEIVIR